MRPDYAELARKLKENHVYLNGCWQTRYSAIRGLDVRASTTSGTSGTGYYYGASVYWSYRHSAGEFDVEHHARFEDRGN